MRQRGRKSADVLALPRISGEPAWLKPPSGLTKPERTLFAELVTSCSPKHFVQSDLPLLVSYVQATLMARRAVRDPGKLAIWEKAVKVQATLATRLRLAPQARTDPKTIARQQGGPASYYDEMRIRDDASPR